MGISGFAYKENIMFWINAKKQNKKVTVQFSILVKVMWGKNLIVLSTFPVFTTNLLKPALEKRDGYRSSPHLL